MTIGALLDLGVDQETFLSHLNSLAVPGYKLKITKKLVNGISGTDFDVVIHHHEHDDHHHPHRNLETIEKIINNSGIEEKAKSLAKRIFHTIARSEAKIHGKEINRVHFHEVGAIDSIVDIVGAAICLTSLNPDKIYASPLHVGSGTVKCAHGILPVPAPATADILRNIPVYATDVTGELVTPTGAAIIKTIADTFGPLPQMKIQQTGYGSGKKSFAIPNLLRVFRGEETDEQPLSVDRLMMLETNIDDMNPEVYSHLIPLLFEQGALDVFMTNIIMKKGRPGILLHVLCEEQDCYKFEEVIFSETSTLGIRRISVDRASLDRKIIKIETEFGEVQAKAAIKNGKFLKIAPEYEDCKRLAKQKNIPLKAVYEAVLTANPLHEGNRPGTKR